MTMNVANKLHLAGNVVLPTACLLAVSIGAAIVINAQTKAGDGQTSHSPAAPHWQTAAGGKMAFEVASVKPSLPDTWLPPTFLLMPETRSPTSSLAIVRWDVSRPTFHCRFT
jgi:hypothetical protein